MTPVKAIDYPHYTEENFAIDNITEFYQYRDIQPQVVEQIETIIKTEGFYPDGYVYLAKHDNTYELFVGNHRHQAAKNAGISHIPAIIYPDLSHSAKLRMALQTNENTQAFAKDTFVDHAELVWKELEDSKKTFEELALSFPDAFTVNKIKRLAGLQRKERKNGDVVGIASNVWELVKKNVVPTSSPVGTTDADGVGTVIVPNGTITENLLRDIIPLRRKHQLELVNAFAHSDKHQRISAGKFKTQAKHYRGRDTMLRQLTQTTGHLPYSILKTAFAEINAGRYDAEWEKFSKLPKAKDGEKGISLPSGLTTLSQSLIETHNEKNSIQLHHGDFYELVKTIPDESIHLVLTDPPYNISRDRVFVRDNATNIDHDFGKGEWDAEEHKDFLKDIDRWLEAFHRVLKPGGSGYIFTSYNYISYIQEAVTQFDGLIEKEPLFWCKTNPAPQFIKTGYRPTVECIVFFVKAGAPHTFHWQGDHEEMMQHQLMAICGGNERRKNAQGETLHPTQKPEKLIGYLMENSSYVGDVVFDGFMGTGTTPTVAKKLKRKCIAFEQNDAYFTDAQRRVADVKK